MEKKKNGLLIDPDDLRAFDEILGKLRRRIEDKLRKEKRWIIPTAKFLGISKKRPFGKGGPHGS